MQVLVGLDVVPQTEQEERYVPYLKPSNHQAIQTILNYHDYLKVDSTAC